MTLETNEELRDQVVPLASELVEIKVGDGF